MSKLWMLILFNIILFLLLIHIKNCNNLQKGGEEGIDINKFMDDTKKWCSNNYDNIIQMTKAYSLCKKSGAEEFNTIAETAKSSEEVTDVLYQ